MTMVIVAEETSRAIIATLNDMLRDPRQIDTWLARHPCSSSFGNRNRLAGCEFS
jgi:hypothetical protein